MEWWTPARGVNKALKNHGLEKLTVTVAETVELLVTVVVLVEVSQGVEVGVELVSHGVEDSCSGN